MSPVVIVFTVLIALTVLFASNRLPVAVVAIAGALALYLTGVVDLKQTVGGFGDPAVVFIATLFVVSEGLEASGVTAWAGQKLIGHAGDSRTRLLVLMMVLVALVTALISVNGAVAALLPVVVVIAVRMRRQPSQLLLPLVFGAHAGSLLTLTGTPVNVIVSEAAAEHGGRAFGYFEFALVGVPLLAGSILIVVVFGERLLPKRTARSMPPDLSRHAHTLAEQYRLNGDPKQLLKRTSGLVEVVIPPRSALVGQKVFPGMITEGGKLVILAIQRGGEDAEEEDGETSLAVGDSLLLQGPWSALDQTLTHPDVLVVDSPELIRARAMPLGLRAKEAIAVLAIMILLLAADIVPAAIAGLLAACAMVQLKVLTVARAYRSISWTTVVLVAAMMPLSTAMVNTGAAGRIADALVGAVEGAGPFALLAGLFVITAIFGQLISNMATALIVIPIATAAAHDLHISIFPVLMCVGVAAAAAFLTPIATPVNFMVMCPGGYRFGDYWKLGLPLLTLFFAVAVFLVPLIWSF